MTGARRGPQHLADELRAAGKLAEPWVEACEAVQRDLLVPPVAWAVPDSPEPGYAIDRDQDPDRWWDAVYSDTSIVTQIDDGAGDLRTGKGTFSSSLSAPGIVFTTLHELDVQDDDTVLDIGTGPGGTACYLSHRVGSQNVVSMEFDEQVAAQAAKNIEALGYAPHLVVGDGAAGYPERAPYDRVHATCAVEQVPYEWVRQTRPGGVIVAPWSPVYGHGQLARLVVDGEGRAIGRFPAFASYMMLRSQRHTPKWAPHHQDDAHEETTQLDPRSILGSKYGADLAIGALAPGIARMPAPTNGDGSTSLLLVEAEPVGGAWAAVDYVPGAADYRVTWYGERNLWQEVSGAYLRWVSWGQPDRERFGMTVTPDSQHLWLDHPRHTLSPAN